MALNGLRNRILRLLKMAEIHQNTRQPFSNTWNARTTKFAWENGIQNTVQDDQILSMLNSCSAEELGKFQYIGREKARRLMSYRKTVGDFKSIQELENISGFTSSVINAIKKKGLVDRKRSSYTKILNATEAQKIQSLTAIDIGSTEIAWCSLTRDCKMLDWNSMEFRILKPYQPREMIESVQNILDAMPTTDIMIVELQNHKSQSKDISVFPYILHNRLTEAVIHSRCKSRSVSLDSNTVRRHFSLPKGINKQYYSMTVVADLLSESRKSRKHLQETETDINDGNSIPGGVDLVQSILSENSNAMSQALMGHEKLYSIKVPQSLIDYFMQKKNKECLSDSLLQALTFLELEL